MRDKRAGRHKKIKVLAFAREAGGAAAIEPVCQAMLEEGWKLLLLADDNAMDVFNQGRMNYIDFPNFDTEVLNRLINKRLQLLPDLVFTSAASLPALDMKEKYLWRWAKRYNIPSAGVVDQWQNYSLRFSGTRKEEHLAYLPDYIFVMDALARDEMVKERIPGKCIVITGQPAFDKIKEGYLSISLKGNEIRSRLHIPAGATIVTFVGESLKKDFRYALGYDEQSVLNFLGNILEELHRDNPGSQIYLIVKLHPENNYEEFCWVLSRWPSFKVKIVKKELTPQEIISISDIVTGMTSIMLIEAILAGKPTVSLQINSLLDSQLVATKAGAIPFINSGDMGREILRRLLYDKIYRQEYLQKQNKFKIGVDATKKCMDIIKTVLGGSIGL